MIELGTSNAASLYVSRLQSAYKSFSWVRDPDFALLQDLDVYETIVKDANTAHAIRQRKHMVAGRAWRCVPASDEEVDKRAAAIVEALLREIKRFASARLNLAEAVFRGSTWAAISGDWGYREPAGETGLWWAPTGLKDVSKLRMRLEQRDDGRREWSAYSVARSAWEPLGRRRAWLVHVVYDEAEETLEHGRGLAQSIYYYQWAKGKVLREGLTALETWSRGIIEAKIDGMRQGSATTRTNAAIATAWLNVLDEMRSRHVIAHDARDEVGVIQGPAEGYAGVVAFLNYLDNGIVRSCLGSVLPTGGDLGQGSFARAETEAESTSDLIAFDRDLQAEALNDDLIGLTWRMNRAPLARAGLARAHPPRFELFADQHADPQKAIAVIEGLQRARVPLKRDEVYEQTGFTPPTEEDDVFEPAEAPTGPMPGAAPAGPLARYAEAERCPDGTFRPEGGDCSGHGPAEEKTPAAPRERAPEVPEKKARRAPPGSQLPPAALARLKALGGKGVKLPAADVPLSAIRLADLDAPDAADKPLAVWPATGKDGRPHMQYAYSAAKLAAGAARKWMRVEALEPEYDALRQDLATRLGAAEAGSADHAALTAAAVIAETALRPGGSAGGRQDHYGVTTMLARHLSFGENEARIEYVGKEGQPNVATVRDPATVRALRYYADRASSPDARLLPTTPEAARAAAGTKLKDFRTVIGTRTALALVAEHAPPPPPLPADAKRAAREVAQVVRGISERVAAVLNNTPAVARSSYIHPRVWASIAQTLGWRRAI